MLLEYTHKVCPFAVVVCSGLLIVIRPALALNGNNKLQNINKLPFIPNLSMLLLTNHDYLVAFSRSDDYSNYDDQFYRSIA